MYDELAIVVGKDMAIGSFAKSYVDLETQKITLMTLRMLLIMARMLLWTRVRMLLNHLP